MLREPVCDYLELRHKIQEIREKYLRSHARKNLNNFFSFLFSAVSCLIWKGRRMEDGVIK